VAQVGLDLFTVVSALDASVNAEREREPAELFIHKDPFVIPAI
jgi:hypothetical protein